MSSSGGSDEGKNNGKVLMHTPEMQKALDLIWEYGGIGGDHHKAWVLDQVVQALCGSQERYERWVAEYQKGDEGPNSYEWEKGIAP